jgi:hypothetical protein
MWSLSRYPRPTLAASPRPQGYQTGQRTKRACRFPATGGTSPRRAGRFGLAGSCRSADRHILVSRPCTGSQACLGRLAGGRRLCPSPWARIVGDGFPSAPAAYGNGGRQHTISCPVNHRVTSTKEDTAAIPAVLGVEYSKRLRRTTYLQLEFV